MLAAVVILSTRRGTFMMAVSPPWPATYSCTWLAIPSTFSRSGPAAIWWGRPSMPPGWSSYGLFALARGLVGRRTSLTSDRS